MADSEAIRRQTKIDSLTKYLSTLGGIDRNKIQAAFDEHAITDFCYSIPFSGHIVHENIRACFKIKEVIINDFLNNHIPWLGSRDNSVLALKEYAADETRPRLSHAFLSTTLIKRWTGMKMYLMFPIEDVNSECQNDYLLRAFTVQLGAAYLREFYNETLQEEMIKEDVAKIDCTRFLKLFLAGLQDKVEDDFRILVVLHGARVEQIIQLVHLLHELTLDKLALVFKILISGQGADRLADRLGIMVHQLPFPDDYHVRILPMQQPDFTEDELLTSPLARRIWHVKKGLDCRVWKKTKPQEAGESSTQGENATPVDEG